MILGCSALLLYVSKIVLTPWAAIRDVRSAAGNAVLPTFDMSLMTISVWVKVLFAAFVAKRTVHAFLHKMQKGIILPAACCI